MRKRRVNEIFKKDGHSFPKCVLVYQQSLDQNSPGFPNEVFLLFQLFFLLVWKQFIA